MTEPSLWSRLKKVRLLHVLVVYLGASWIVIEVTDTLQGVLSLPEWTAPVAFVLLLSGLVVILATAWVQSHPMLDAREAAGEVPDSWEVGVRDFGRSLRRGRMPHLTWGRALVGGLFVFSLLFGFGGMYVIFQERGRPLGPDILAAEEMAAPGVAVVPFSVSAPELDLWREGLVDLLSTNLDGLGGLRGIDSRTMLARWGEAVPHGGRADLATMLEVARAARARWALVGSLVGTSQQVRLSADIYDVASGAKVGTAQAEGGAEAIMSLVDELAIGVARVLLGEAAGETRIQHLSSLTTTSLPALQAYLEGEALYRRSEFDAAIDAFSRAVAEDSTFALAWARLHDAYGWTAVAGDAYRESLERMHRHEARLPTRERIVVRSQAAFAKGLLHELPSIREATRRYPDDPEVWYELGEYYTHFEGQVADAPDSALAAISRAIELDPSFGPYYIHAVDLAIWTGDSARAAELLAGQRRASPESDYHVGSALAFDLVFGDDSVRERAWREVDTRPPGRSLGWAGFSLFERRYSPVREEFRRRLHVRLGEHGTDYAEAVADQGRVREALGFLREQELASFTNVAVLVGARTVGLELPLEEVEEQVLADTSGRPIALIGRGVLGASGRPAELRSVLDRIEGLRVGASEAGDTVEARRWAALAQALQGYATWRGGDAERGRAAIEAARPHITGWIGGDSGPWVVPAAFIRGWLGEIEAELGRPREAAAHFRSLYVAPTFGRVLALYRLGDVYDQLGEREKARRAYEEFVALWADADPELQPLVQEARRRLATMAEEEP